MAYPFMELADRVRRHFNGAGNPHAESTLTFTDITTNDVSTTLHGFVPKAPNDLSKFLRGDGTWATELFEVGHHRVRVEPINLAVANSVVTGSGTTAAFAAGRGWQLNTGATNPSTAS